MISYSTSKLLGVLGEVMAFSQLQGAAGDLFVWILKGRARLYNHVLFSFCVYLVLFIEVIRLFI